MSKKRTEIRAILGEKHPVRFESGPKELEYLGTVGHFNIRRTQPASGMLNWMKAKMRISMYIDINKNYSILIDIIPWHTDAVSWRLVRRRS